MTVEQIISTIVAIATGSVTVVLLLIRLYKVLKEAIKTKNWSKLLELLFDLMATAESKFNDGATRKEWVMAMAQTSAEFADYPLEINQLSQLIDDLCKLTKKINVNRVTVEGNDAV